MKKLILLFLCILTVTVYAGDSKIVFSKSPIDATTGETLPPGTFEVGEKIYCHAYLSKNLNKYKDEISKSPCTGAAVRVFLDGKQYNKVNIIDFNSAEEAGTTNIPFIFNDRAKGDFAAALNNLPNGTYVVRVEMHVGPADDKKSIAKGEFTLIKSATSAKTKVGKSLDDIKAGMVDPKLESQAIERIKETGYVNLINDKTKILNKDWKIVRHPDTGVITHRYLVFAFVNKGKSDGSCTVVLYALHQNYEGGGYQKTFSKVLHVDSIDYLSTTSYYVDCP